MTFKKFKEDYPGSYFIRAAEDIPGFCKKGMPIYGYCDNCIVDNWLLHLTGAIYTVFLKSARG